ncbi:arginine--tRNA ligase [Lysinibacillus odysseyi]|uniref:Arginine--tRNA ligase n=1 Tax=Lysinibacillus odysseyi 34hs-1 = NBRC 100172 TaxID=1220589 RepID=A0A0A3IGD9_9BACI|nr:arginine--tRNA ligase [Lysinibacillus odysseyi]KGR81883.1 arginine--tRNA ligase [Lysinibacillus odysseyi 34hs-1 = NBRC 100172]
MQEQIIRDLEQALEGQLNFQEIDELLEKPKYDHLGDVAFPCFSLAKKLRKSPQIIAAEVAGKLQKKLYKDVQPVGGYINIYYKQENEINRILNRILNEQKNYGSKHAVNANVVIDFSSPNIAKPFSMGHLRSTVIGNALANLAEKNGFQAIRINHLGDWGTQFGKLIVAYKLWGDREAIASSPIEELLKIYVKFHEEAEKQPELNDLARQAFKGLEETDEEATELWKWFREVSLAEFTKVYEQLGISFDSYHGEAFYNDKMEPAIQELKEKGLLVESDGAYVVEVEDMPPCLITKKDGATLYATRDLAAAMYRWQEYEPAKFLYVVGNEQSLHFNQLFAVIQKMGYGWSERLMHVPFGMVLKDGKKMSTRKGKVVLLTDVLSETIEMAKKNIELKNPTLEEKEKIAEYVGVGAVIFNDLKNHRMNDIEFSIEQMLNFEGETGPYIQYTFARISSLLYRAQYRPGYMEFASLGEAAWPAILLLDEFPKTVEEAYDQADPSLVAKYALRLARAYNKYYAKIKVLADDEAKQQRLAFSCCVAIVLEEALRLLGMKAPKNM